MRATHMPVKVLGLQINREDIGLNGVQGTGDVLGGSGFQVSRRRQRGIAAGFEVFVAGKSGVLRSTRIYA